MRILRSGALAALALSAPACDSADTKASAIEAIASQNPGLISPSSEPAPPPPPPPKKVIRRPGPAEELLVTEERRQRLEERHPQAAGFVTARQLEEELYELELPRGKDDKALRHLDRMAKGKWILFTGHITNAKDDSFELAIRYTPRDPEDPMGVTSQWIPVTLKGVEGYDKSEYRPGELAVILAKYNGKKDASPGYDLILLDQWYE